MSKVNVRKERWVASNGSISTERAFEHKPNLGKPYKARQAIAFNVDHQTANHIVRLHNDQLGASTQSDAPSYHNIPKAEHENVVGCYWMMLRQLEENARSSNSALEKSNVEAFYRVWNRMTGDDKVPYWLQNDHSEVIE